MTGGYFEREYVPFLLIQGRINWQESTYVRIALQQMEEL